MEQNNILFEERSPMTFKEAYDFYKFNYNINTKVILIFDAVIVLLGIISALFTDINHGIIIFYLVLIIFFSIIRLITPYFYAKILSSPQIRQNNFNHNCFYQDCFVNTTINSQSVIYYNKLLKALEVNDYFYLYIQQNKAFIIKKADFLFNTPEEMRNLLQIKLGYKFKSKVK